MTERCVYICSPFSSDPEGNTIAAREYCRTAFDAGLLPVAPHLYFPQFCDDEDPEEREYCLSVCEKLIEKCEEVWVFGSHVSSGMAREIRHAIACGIPVRFMQTAPVVA